MKFLTIHMLLTPLQLVLVLLYLISPSLTVVNTLVSRHDKSFFGTCTGASNKALFERDLM